MVELQEPEFESLGEILIIILIKGREIEFELSEFELTE